MKKTRLAALAVVPAMALVAAGAFGFTHIHSAHANAPSCTPTGFYRDSINMTAAVINPSGAYHGDHGVLDATGCNIGIYYGSGSQGVVGNVEIYGANYFGIVNNGGDVVVTHNTIHDIGENPLNGTQHGVGVYFTYDSGAHGQIVNNTIYHYQKGGIVVNGASDSAMITHNTVLGEGPVTYIAQNGIQVGYGASATVQSNLVTGNAYSGANDASSGGILVVGGGCYGSGYTTNTRITDNTVLGNDIGVWLSNVQGDCFSPPTTPTNIQVGNNFIRDDAVTNSSGYITEGYQAGIADQGDYDSMTNNTVCGEGYTPGASASAYTYFIDDTATNNPYEHGNNVSSTCDGPGNGANAGAPHAQHAKAAKPASTK